MRQPELFEGSDFGKPRPSLARARELVAEVEALEEYEGSDLWGHCERLASRARASGAHSVARAVCWYGCTLAFDRHGPDAVERITTAAARRWLARLERAR